MNNLISNAIDHPFKTVFLVSAVVTGITKILQVMVDFKKANDSK